MVFVADDLAAWLIGALADAGRRRLTTVVLGNDQERALRQAATAAVQLTARELRPDDGERAEELEMVVNQIFSEPTLGAPLAGQATLLEVMQAGIAGQLAVLDDPGLTGTGESSADVLEVPAIVLADRLVGHVVRQIVARGARGGPLEPLASQLNHDMTHLQGQQLVGMVGELAEELRGALARSDDIRTVAAAPVALAQLPPSVAGFTGRDGELTVLAGLLDPTGAAGPVVVSAVAGLAGVGKTTLAVQAGHAAQGRGWFDGGVLFIDLHGYDESPVEPGQALDALLRSLGVAAEHIPPGAEERAGLYRSALAKMSAPVLLIADNASSETQVRPLLPGTGPHKVLVTSRHTLAGLDARLVDVAVLDETASGVLLDEVLHAARPDDDRVSCDWDAARRLAGVCGGLPLALQIVGALLKADPTLGTGELADELAVEQGRLERLAYDDGSRATRLSIAAAFELSYNRLDEVSARVFRLLPVNPGSDVSTAAAAVVSDLPVTEVRKVLASLARAHLAEVVTSASGRWRMHDLLRLYAQRLCDAHADKDGRKQAIHRLLNYYLTMTRAADDHLRGLPGMPVSRAFTDRDDALGWLDAEWSNLVAAVRMAADVGRDQAAMHLPSALNRYLNLRRRFDDLLATDTISLNVARRLGDRINEASTLLVLGTTLREMRRFEEAITTHQNAAAIYRKIGDRHGVGMALNNLGSALQGAQQFEEAINAHKDAAAIFRETGDRHREGQALNSLGGALQGAQQFEEAINVHKDAAAIFRETGDRHREGMALTNLGGTMSETGRFEEAITACQEGKSIFREAGDRYGEGIALYNVGKALHMADLFEDAVTAYQDAVAIFHETGDRYHEGVALGNLGAVLQEMRRFGEAVTACEDAAAMYHEIGDLHSEGIALGNLEEVRSALATEEP